MRALGVGRLTMVAGVGLGVVAYFVYLMVRLATPEMTLLYSGLEMNDSSQIVSKLNSMGVPYELQANGAQITVPADRVLDIRMTLAQDNLPASGSVGYEIFDRGEGLGSSNFLNDVNRVRALEGELARTIRAINNVREARVHLVVPRRELFSKDKQEPSAAIVLKLAGQGQLSTQQVRAIQHLVASAVPGLKPSHISMVDQAGNLLVRSADDDAMGASGASNADEMRQAYEERSARAIEELIERSLGPGRVRVQVSAEIDFDRIATTSETFDPDGQVVRSTQSVEEDSGSNEATSENTVSVAGNLPPTESQAPPGAQRSATRANRSEETVNYEISKTVKNHVKETGTVRRLSVAVLVDGTYKAGADGAGSYTPRTAEELNQLATLVRSAIGYNEERGDKVDVVNLRFTQPTAEAEAAAPSFLDTLDLGSAVRLSEHLVLSLVALLMLLLVIRPFVKRLVGPEAAAEAAAAARQPLLSDQSPAQQALAAPVRGPATVEPAEPERPEQMIDIRSIEGKLRASSVNKIGEIVDRHPDESLTILRSWMAEGSA
ncbi:MAG: flagellar basal-body MS-ring/collar protein FliF [Alphaproteobacteria bacterium]